LKICCHIRVACYSLTTGGFLSWLRGWFSDGGFVLFDSACNGFTSSSFVLSSTCCSLAFGNSSSGGSR